MARAALNYCRVEDPIYQEITADQISYTSTTVQDAINALATAIEWRTDQDGNLAPYSGDQRITAMDNWATTSLTTSTSSDITISDGTSSYKLADTVNELKDEIQFLKDEINNLKMLLLEN